MTHEQYIILETSKLAKQAGFDWECVAYYGCSAYDEGNERSFTLLKDNYYGIQNWNEKESWNGLPRFSAPTQSVLQRWLREVKGIYLHIAFDKAENGWYTYIPDTDEYSKTYSTFEEALEVGLQNCLKLLI